MKNIIFKTLSISNFLSIGNEPVVINFKKGLNFITGENKDKPERKNGVGKSSIADGLHFAIFGETLREIKKDLIVNNIVGGTTSTVLTFDVQTSTNTSSYKIIRTLNPSKVQLFENDTDITRDTIANTNKFITELLSATPQIFQNCVIMTINNTIPFMAKSRVDKRKFIEDIFGLEVFSDMLSVVRSEYNDIIKEHSVEEAKFGENNSSLITYNKQKDTILQSRQEKLAKYIQRQQNNERNKSDLVQKVNSLKEENVKDLESKLVDLEKITNNINIVIDSITKEITTKSVNIKHLNNGVQEIGTDKEVCKKCLRPMHDKDHEHIKSEKTKIKNQIDLINKDIVEKNKELELYKEKKIKVNTAIKQIEKKISSNRLVVQEKENLNDKIEQIDKWQITLVDDIEQAKQQNTDFDVIIQDLQTRLTALETKISELKKKLNMYDVIKFIISEEGVKSYIVKLLLDQLNSKLIHFLQRLDSNCICYFNEFFDEEVLNEQKKICSYFNFSSAERKSIDLACLFTFSDIRRLQGGVQYNIAFYDELFDSSFDEKGIELIAEILKERIEKYDECVYVITHRKESLKNLTGEVIYLQKQNGVTQLVEAR